MNRYQNAIYMLKSVTGAQMNSFVITTDDGKVIAIDGGNLGDADYFIEFLCELTGEDTPHLDAWFLTHAHSDHIDVFLEIIENRMGAVTFDKLCCHLPSAQFYKAKSRRDNNASARIDRFYSLLPRFADKLLIVSRGDLYEFGNAQFKILYTHSEMLAHQQCNNSSVVMRLELGGRSAIFFADAEEDVGNLLLEHYRESGELDCDVCQMAHHGQCGVSKEVYEAVRPEVCFWCAPNWLWDNDDGNGFNTHIYKTVETRVWMEELGVKKHFVLKDGTQAYTW